MSILFLERPAFYCLIRRIAVEKVASREELFCLNLYPTDEYSKDVRVPAHRCRISLEIIRASLLGRLSVLSSVYSVVSRGKSLLKARTVGKFALA